MAMDENEADRMYYGISAPSDKHPEWVAAPERPKYNEGPVTFQMLKVYTFHLVRIDKFLVSFNILKCF